MKVTVNLRPPVSGFAEDKDEARLVRVDVILPVLKAGGGVILDFSEVRDSTQSYMHALIGEVLQRYGEEALDKLEFHSCSPQVKSLVQLVVDYSLGGFTSDDVPLREKEGPPRRKNPHPRTHKQRNT